MCMSIQGAVVPAAGGELLETALVEVVSFRLSGFVVTPTLYAVDCYGTVVREASKHGVVDRSSNLLTDCCLVFIGNAPAHQFT